MPFPSNASIVGHGDTSEATQATNNDEENESTLERLVSEEPITVQPKAKPPPPPDPPPHDQGLCCDAMSGLGGVGTHAMSSVYFESLVVLSGMTQHKGWRLRIGSESFVQIISADIKA